MRAHRCHAGVQAATQGLQCLRFCGDQRRQRQGIGAIPVRIEYLLGLAHRRPHQRRIHIHEIGVARRIEIFVAHVAPTHHRDAAIGNPGLVVHAAVDAEHAQHHLHAAHQGAFARAGRVEQANLDQRMAIQGGQHRIAAMDIHVVQQQSHAYAAIGRAQQLVVQQVAGEIGVPDVVLQIQAAPGRTRGERTYRKCIDVVRQDHHAGLIGMRLLQWRHHLVDGRRDRRGRQHMTDRPALAVGKAPVALQR